MSDDSPSKAELEMTSAESGRDWTPGGPASQPEEAIPSATGDVEAEEELLRTLDEMVQNSAEILTAASEGLAPVESKADKPPQPPAEPLERAAYTHEESTQGQPEDWTALAALGALDGDGVQDLSVWLQSATEQEREVYTHRIRVGQCLIYALDQAPPPPGLRDELAGRIGEMGRDKKGRLFPSARKTWTQKAAAKIGWPQTRLLKILLVCALGLGVGGWVLAWHAQRQIEIVLSASVQAEKRRHEGEIARFAAAKKMEYLGSADLKTTALHPASGEGAVKVNFASVKSVLLWSPYALKGLLWIQGLPPAAPAHEYALWVSSGNRHFQALRFQKTNSQGQGDFLEIPSLQSGRPRPIQAFYLVSQPIGAVDPERGERILAGNAYF